MGTLCRAGREAEARRSLLWWLGCLTRCSAGAAPLLAGCATTAGGAERLVHELTGFPAVAVRQEEPVWCWAACSEMILRFHGIETSQTEIAARIDGADAGGALKVETASRYEVLCALNPELPRTEFEALWQGLSQQVLDANKWLEGNYPAGIRLNRPQAFQAAFDRLAPGKFPMIEDLIAGQPAVVGLRDSKESQQGHAYVLFGATYSPREQGIRDLLPAFLRSPAADELLGADLTAEVRAQQADWKKDMEQVGIQSPAQFLESKKYVVHEVQLVDPWDGQRVRMPYEEFSQRVDFVITKSYAHKILQAWQGALRVESK